MVRDAKNWRQFLLALVYTRIGSFIAISVIIAILVIDTSLLKIYYFGIHEGTILFTIVSSVYLVGQYFVLGLGRQIIKKQKNLARLFKIVTLVQYALTGVILSVVIEIIISSSYATLNLSLALWLSTGLAIVCQAFLSYRLLSWFLVRRNSVALLYAISSLALIINFIFTIAIVSAILNGTKPYSTARVGVYTPFFSLGPLTQLVNNGYILSSILSFVITWCATAVLLRHYSATMGRIKYWIILTSPLVFFLLQFQPLFLDFFAIFPFTDPVSFSVLYTLVFTLSKPIGGILFGIAFWTIARKLGQANIVSNYMIVSSYGFALLFISNQAIVLVSAPYPPFGLATISFTGLSSFLVTLGIYSSAVSLAHDAKLRQIIKTSALEQTRLLDSIGLARMEEEISKNVLKVVKANREELENETGVRTSLDDEELKNYLSLVQHEIKEGKSRRR